MIFSGFIARSLVMAAIVGGVLLAPSAPLVWAAEEGDRTENSANVELPPLPQAANLIPVYVAPNSTNRFYIDGASLSVAAAGLIRYTIVIKSPSGASTVNFEGMRCPDWLRVLYAFGQSDGTWKRARNSEWKPIGGSGPNGYQYVLYRHHFCPEGVPVRDAGQAAAVLQRGADSAARLLP